MVQALGLEAVLDLARAAQMVIMPVLEVGVEVVEVATTVGKHMGVGRAQALVNIVQ
jgi:dUTPase